MVNVQTKTFLIINTVVFLIFSLIILIMWITESSNETTNFRSSNLLFTSFIFLVFFYAIMIFNPYHSIFKLGKYQENTRYPPPAEYSSLLRDSYKIGYLVGLIFLVISIVLYIIAIYTSSIKANFQTISYIMLTIIFVLYVGFMILLFSRPLQGDITKRTLTKGMIVRRQ